MTHQAARMRLPVALTAGAIAAQIAYPLASSSLRPFVTTAVVILFAAASVSHAAVTRGGPWALAYVIVVGGVGLLVEAVGVATGIPFGDYVYNDSLGPAVWDVPLLIPVAWLMMAYPAYVAGRRLVPRHPVRRVLVAAWALAAWDLFLDPRMVSEGHWSWSTEGRATLPGVPDVPVSNYVGWFVVALVMMALLESARGLARPRGRLADAPDGLAAVDRRADRDDAVPYALYLWTYVSSVLATAVFWGSPAAALWGGLAMGLVALPLAVTLYRARETDRSPSVAATADRP